MSPTLRKLSKRGLGALEAAELLRRHVGDAPAERHCRDAIDALTRIRDTELNAVTRVLARMANPSADPCAAVQEVIELLQGLGSNTPQPLERE
jgi:hypothetical protein